MNAEEKYSRKKFSRKELDDLHALTKYKEAFDTFDWNRTGNIATHVSIINVDKCNFTFLRTSYNQ